MNLPSGVIVRLYAHMCTSHKIGFWWSEGDFQRVSDVMEVH